MVLTRSTQFVLQVVLIFLAIGNIQALGLKGFETGTGKINARDRGGVQKMEIDIPTATWDELSFNRKMMMMKLDKVSYNNQASKISGATNFTKKSNLKRKHRLKNNSKLMKSRNAHPVNVKLRNFMVLNADYHVPRPHPPKNN